MPVMADRWIIEMAEQHRMIDPFARDQVKSGISFGVSSYGYDFRLADEFKLLDTARVTDLDPKNSRPETWRSEKAGSILIPANSFILARSLEYFRIPRNIITLCTGKSTYSRSGLIVNVTPFEPEWEGYVTLEISNTTPLPARIYSNEGIAQVLFFEADEVCEISYADKKGKYQSQQSIVLPKL